MTSSPDEGQRKGGDKWGKHSSQRDNEKREGAESKEEIQGEIKRNAFERDREKKQFTKRETSWNIVDF